MFARKKLPLYPKVRILASQMSGSSGKNFSGQKRSRSLFFDQVRRLVPPRPCTKMMSALRLFFGSKTTRRPSGSASLEGLLLRSVDVSVSIDGVLNVR